MIDLSALRRKGFFMRLGLLTALLFVSTIAASLGADETAKTVVNFAKLLPFLPEPPEGWTAEKPEGSTSETPGFKITTAGRSYTKGDGDAAPTGSINITDATGNQPYIAATMAGWNMKSETTDGYDKSVTIDGNPGFEHFEKESKTGTLWVVVGQRFFVQVELTNQDPAELQAWMKRIDLKKLAAVK